MKIIAVCPECGKFDWIPNKDGSFTCSFCGVVVDSFEMPLKAEDDLNEKEVRE